MKQAVNNNKKVLSTIMLNHHPFADEIKRHPEAEVLLVTRDNRHQAMNKALDWLTGADRVASKAGIDCFLRKVVFYNSQSPVELFA